MQRDLFAHGRDVMLRNNVIAALRRREVAAGWEAPAVLPAEYPRDGLLVPMAALLQTLDAPLGCFSHHNAAADALHSMNP
jgi:hypothetical protein